MSENEYVDPETGLTASEAEAEYERRLTIAENIYGSLSEREQALVREATLMSFVRGVQFAGGLAEGATYPADEVIIIDALYMMTLSQEIFPTLGTYPSDEEEEESPSEGGCRGS